MKIEDLFNNIEKVLRYLVPAFVFTILLRHFYPCIYNRYIYELDQIRFIFYFTLSGIIIYSIHRVIFEIIDWLFIRCVVQKSLKDVIKGIVEEGENLRESKNYFYFKTAMIHSCLITVELVGLFILIDRCNYVPGCVWLLFILLFIISFVVYLIYLSIHIEIILERRK